MTTAIIYEHLRTSTAVSLLSTMLGDRDFGPVPMLVDELRDSGATDAELTGILMRLVCAAPESDAVRLAWAGLVGGERGEFVKVQLRLTEIADWRNRRGLDKSAPVGLFGEQERRFLNDNEYKRLRRREKLLFNKLRFPAPEGFDCGIDHFHRDDVPQANVAHGFISSLTCSWSDFLRVHRNLIWSPEMTDECPRCKGSGVLEQPSAFGDCKVACSCYTPLGGSKIQHGRVPRPFPEAAQPITDIRITESPERGQSSAIVSTFNLPDGKGGWIHFDRVRCSTCDGRRTVRMARIPPFSAKAPQPDEGPASALEEFDAPCPDCRVPLNRWRCPEWPQTVFQMPTQ